MKRQKGFTLVELLVTLGLAGIIISTVMSFFIANIKNYQTINTTAELQYQSQYIVNYITNKFLEANNIISVNDNVDESGKKDISTVTFKIGSEVLKFKVDADKKIIYVDKDSNNIELGSNVLNLSMSPIPDGKFTDANGLEIELILKDGKQQYIANQTVFMRNHQR